MGEVSEEGLVPCFVYGTLRVGHSNYEWAKPAVQRESENATISGRLYHVADQTWTPIYPLAKVDRPGIIHGDVLWFDEASLLFAQVVSMEIRSGYEVANVTATLEDGTEQEVSVFHYRGRPTGPWIRSGDWNEFCGILKNSEVSG